VKKLMNGVESILTESLAGFAAAHADLVKLAHDPTFVARARAPVQGKVALISGGGSGHEPLHAGFVGYGMLDAACPGQVFTSPTPDQMLAAAEAVDGGAGILFIVKNYTGDVMNFEMAAEMAPGEHASVLTNDDVAVEDSTYTTGRRGVAGTVVVEKIVGAAAEGGADLAARARRHRRPRRRRCARRSARSDPRSPVTSLPSSRMRPAVGISSPAIIRSVVVLPQPEGPSSTKNWPCPMVRVKSRTATKSSKRFCTSMNTPTPISPMAARSHGARRRKRRSPPLRAASTFIPGPPRR
jgi:dihydroxyacetone kinase-like protein